MPEDIERTLGRILSKLESNDERADRLESKQDALADKLDKRFDEVRGEIQSLRSYGCTIGQEHTRDIELLRAARTPTANNVKVGTVSAIVVGIAMGIVEVGKLLTARIGG